MNTIICAAYNNWELSKITLDSLVKHTEQTSRIIFINNGSTDGTRNWMEKEADQGPFPAGATRHVNIVSIPYNEKAPWYKVTFVDNLTNGGCGIGRNIGARLVENDSDYITFVDNDIVATPGWDTEMILFMNAHPEVGVCGPMTNFAGTPQLLDKSRYTFPQSVDEVAPFAERFKSANRGRWAPVPNGFVIIGFCMMIRKACFDQLRLPDGGLFDERFKLYGNEDNDFCRRATQAGWRLAYFGGCYVHHWGSKSLQALAESGIDWGKQWNENKKVFEDKWKGVH